MRLPLTSYLAANAVILPASSWFSLRFGRKCFLLTCIVLFTVASFACGSAFSLGMIVIARALQGAAGGALQPLSQAILLESFPPEKRGQAMSVFGLGVVVAPIVGPTLGGWITDQYSWRWAFFISRPAPPNVAARRSYALLNDQLQRQAAILSYIDVFRYLGSFVHPGRVSTSEGPKKGRSRRPLVREFCGAFHTNCTD